MLRRGLFWLFAALLTCCGTSVEAAGTAVRSLPVPRETLFPGDVITADRLVERQFQTTAQSVRGFATDSSEILGKETRRRLVAGMPIALGGLGTPMVVRRGAAGTAVFQDDGFSISTSVVALSDGASGDVIDARSVETGAVIKVQVLPGGELAVVGE